MLTLDLYGCVKLEKLPRGIGNLISLRHLYITTKQVIFPEEEIGSLITLQSLWIGGCGNLKSLGEGMQHLTALRTLVIRYCENLESLPRSMKYLTALETLGVHGCEKLNLEQEQDAQGIMLSLRWLSVRYLRQLVSLPQWLQGASNTLQHIHIRGCLNLSALPEWLPNITSLQKLEIFLCPKFPALPDGMHCLATLRELKIDGCFH